MKKINHAITKKYPHQPGSRQKLSDKIHRIPLPPLARNIYTKQKNTKMLCCSLILCHKLSFYTKHLSMISPHFIKFNVERGSEFTHWERCLVYGLRIYQNFAIIFLNCQTKLGLIKFIYSMVKVYQTILIHGLKQFSWKLKHFHTEGEFARSLFTQRRRKSLFYFFIASIFYPLFLSVCWRQRGWVKQ